MTPFYKTKKCYRGGGGQNGKYQTTVIGRITTITESKHPGVSFPGVFGYRTIPAQPQRKLAVLVPGKSLITSLLSRQ